MVIKKKNYMDQQIINSAKLAVNDLMKLSLLGDSRLWVDFDREADVLYVNFEKPQNADNSIMEGNTIIHKRGNKIVGMTITNASKYRTG